MSERKYTKGALVYSVGCFEALGNKWFIVNGKTMHRSFLESMTYRTLAGFILRRQVYEALTSGTTAELKEAGCFGNTARAVFTEEIET